MPKLGLEEEVYPFDSASPDGISYAFFRPVEGSRIDEAIARIYGLTNDLGYLVPVADFVGPKA